MLNWLINNKEWVLSGIGVFLLNMLLFLFFKRNKPITEQNVSPQNIMISGDVSGVVNLNIEEEKQSSKKNFFQFKVFGIPILVIEIFIGVYLITIFNNNLITKMEGVSVGGNVKILGDSSITGRGDIIINRTVLDNSDRIVSIQKRLRNLQSQDPVINSFIQKAKDAFYANNLDDAEKFLKEIDLIQRGNP